MPLDKMPKTEEAAALAVSEKVESIRKTLLEIIEIADEFGLRVEVLREWDEYLTYQGRMYEDDGVECYRGDGGWYSSNC
jgi:hypothetical protein